MSAIDNGRGRTVNADPPTLRYNPGERARLLVLVLCGTVLDGANFALFTAFLPPLAHWFGVSVLRMAAIQTASYVAGIAGAPLFGRLADQRGRRAALTVAVASFGLTSLGTALSGSWAVLALWRVLAGMAIGGEVGVGLALLNEAWPARRRGAANGLLQAVFATGTVVSAGLFAWSSRLYGAEGWRFAFAWLALGGFVAAAIRLTMPESKLWLICRASPPVLAGADHGKGGVRWAESRRMLLLFSILACFAFAGTTPLTNYVSVVWLTIYRVSPGVLAAVVVSGTLAAFLSYLLCGALADIWGRRAAFCVPAFLGAAGYAFYGILAVTGLDRAAVPSGQLAPSSLAVLWIASGYGYLPVMGCWLAESFPTDVRATSVDLAVCIGRGLGGGLAPLGVLALTRALGLDARAAIAAGSLGMLGAALVGLRLPETRGRALALTAADVRGMAVE